VIDSRSAGVTGIAKVKCRTDGAWSITTGSNAYENTGLPSRRTPSSRYDPSHSGGAGTVDTVNAGCSLTLPSSTAPHTTRHSHGSARGAPQPSGGPLASRAAISAS
jgi:hypothetical protein